MTPDNRKFWVGVFSESDGTPSFSRVATGFLLCFAVGWVSCLVVKHWQLPDFAGLIAFVGVLYGINKAGNIASNYANKSEPQK